MNPIISNAPDSVWTVHHNFATRHVSCIADVLYPWIRICWTDLEDKFWPGRSKYTEGIHRLSNILFLKCRRSAYYQEMTEYFVLEKQIFSFRPLNIVIIKYRMFSSSYWKKPIEEFYRILKQYSNKQVCSSAMFPAHIRSVIDACVALVTGNQIPPWPDFAALPVNIVLAVQQVAQSLCT